MEGGWYATLSSMLVPQFDAWGGRGRQGEGEREHAHDTVAHTWLFGVDPFRSVVL